MHFQPYPPIRHPLVITNPMTPRRHRLTFLPSTCLVILTLVTSLAHAQIPGLTETPKPSAKSESSNSAVTAPTADNPEASVAESTGPIAVTRSVNDSSIERKLDRLLPKYPGVNNINVEVEEGVVTLTGHVEDNEVRDRLRDFVRRVEGVNLVLNQTKTDAQVLSAQDFAFKKIQEFWAAFSRKWLLAVFALGMVIAAAALARLFKRYSETLLIPFTGNPLLRSVLGSLIALALIVGGVLVALNILGMTEAVLSFLGLAGVVALAVGFAFRDIAENFIASIMLGIRRPFRVGDFVEVAGKAGVVKALNTRATVLVNLDGSQIRIPNAIIFKEILVNRTASESIRSGFDVIVPWDSSISQAIEAISGAIAEHEGIEDNPSPRTLVQAIEPGGIRLRTLFWHPPRGVDSLKLLSDAQLMAKVALQKIGIDPSPAPVVVELAEGVYAPLPRPRPQRSQAPPNLASSKSEEATKTEKNLREDDAAAKVASAQQPNDQSSEMNHALDIATSGVSDEGADLLSNNRTEE